MALILEEIAIDNETRVSVRRTKDDLQKAEDLHKTALDLARYIHTSYSYHTLILTRTWHTFIFMFLLRSVGLPHSVGWDIY